MHILCHVLSRQKVRIHIFRGWVNIYTWLASGIELTENKNSHILSGIEETENKYPHILSGRRCYTPLLSLWRGLNKFQGITSWTRYWCWLAHREKILFIVYQSKVHHTEHRLVYNNMDALTIYPTWLKPFIKSWTSSICNFARWYRLLCPSIDLGLWKRVGVNFWLTLITRVHSLKQSKWNRERLKTHR